MNHKHIFLKKKRFGIENVNVFKSVDISRKNHLTHKQNQLENVPEDELEFVYFKESKTTMYSVSEIFQPTLSRLSFLSNFFSVHDFLIPRVVIPLITGTSTLSLRILSWFSTNKTVMLFDENYGDYMSVYAMYRTWLDRWGKTMFDAFRRRDRIYFKYNDIFYTSTCAQLNFFFWVITSGVLLHVHNNVDRIIKEKNLSSELVRKKKKLNIYKKKHRQPKSQQCTIFYNPCNVHF